MLGMGFGEIVVVVVVAVIVLGPEKLPKAIVDIVKFIKGVKDSISSVKANLDNELKIAELREEAALYKKNLEEATSNARKKLSFEELDEIKKAATDPLKSVKDVLNQELLTSEPTPQTPATTPATTQTNSQNSQNANLTTQNEEKKNV